MSSPSCSARLAFSWSSTFAAHRAADVTPTSAGNRWSGGCLRQGSATAGKRTWAGTGGPWSIGPERKRHRFAVYRRQDLDAWQDRLAALGVEHSPVADTEVGSALVFRDPDHIQLELWWSKPSAAEPTLASHAQGVVERSSPRRADETVQRLADAGPDRSSAPGT